MRLAGAIIACLLGGLVLLSGVVPLIEQPAQSPAARAFFVVIASLGGISLGLVFAAWRMPRRMVASPWLLCPFLVPLCLLAAGFDGGRMSVVELLSVAVACLIAGAQWFGTRMIARAGVSARR